MPPQLMQARPCYQAVQNKFKPSVLPVFAKLVRTAHQRARPSCCQESRPQSPASLSAMRAERFWPTPCTPPTAQLAGTEDQQSRPSPPPRQGLDPAGRLGHAGTHTSAGTHGRRSGGADGRRMRPMRSRCSKAATASRRPWQCQGVSLPALQQRNLASLNRC